MTEVIDLPLATLDETGNVPADQLGNAALAGTGLPGWTATTAYLTGHQVSHNGQLYAALIDHTSASTFDATKWLLLGQVPTSVVTNTSSDPTSPIAAPTTQRNGALRDYRTGADYGFDASANDVNATPWANMVADLSSWTRGRKLYLPAGDYCLNNVTWGPAAHGMGKIEIEGEGGATRILPGGGQGRALTLKGQGGDRPVILRNLHLGWESALTQPADLAYSQPMVEIQQSLGYVIEGVSGQLQKTGQLIYLNDSYNGTVKDLYLSVGQYGIPLSWDLASLSGADQADTMLFQRVVVKGAYGLVFNNFSSGLYTLELDQFKVVGGVVGGVTYAESYLASNAAAAASTITLNPGDGTSFAAGDSLGIDVGKLGFGANSGMGFEVNKVLSIAGDVLTLVWPLRYDHNVTSGNNPHHVQVVRGGVGVVLSDFQNSSIHDSHFEGPGIGILAWDGNGLMLDRNTDTCQRFLRLASGMAYVRIGQTQAAGTAVANTVVDIPSWNPSTPSFIDLAGPFVGAPPTVPKSVNYFGTSYPLNPGVVSTAAAYTLTGAEQAVCVTSTATVSFLPTSFYPTHRRWSIKNYGSGVTTTVQTAGTNKIDAAGRVNATSMQIGVKGDSVDYAVAPNGTDWAIL